MPDIQYAVDQAIETAHLGLAAGVLDPNDERDARYGIQIAALAPDLLDLLIAALPYVEEGEAFNHPDKRTLSARIRATLTDADYI